MRTSFYLLRISLAAVTAVLLAAAPASAADFPVTNTSDTGAGSLRQAMLDANSTPGTDTISFNIPATDPNCNTTTNVCTIKPASSFPFITDAVTIDGYTQPGASANTQAVGSDAVLLIEIDGSAAPITGSFAQAGFTIANPGNSTIRGLVINRFADPRFVGIPGIIVISGGNVIEGNFIGTDPTGTIDRGNGTHGISLGTGANNRIGGLTPQARNLISGNGTTGQGNPGNGIVVGGSGDQLEPPTDFLILGNYIGTSAAGTAALPNSDTGIVVIESLGGRIGMPGGRNLISGHAGGGITVSVISTPGVPSSESFNLSIQSNYIGIDATGENAIPNSSGIGVGSDFDTQSDLNIGGTGAGEGNVLSGNRDFGLGVGSARVVNIQGNFVGTHPAGNRAISNGAGGMYFPINPNAPSDYQFTIGGDVPGARNIISGNGGDGVNVGGQNNGFVKMRRNFIGTQSDGVSPLGNDGNGIALARSATVGGLAAGDGNVIAHNGADGVIVTAFDQPAATSGMAILGNSIFSNAGLGIDLRNDGVTANDVCDEDSGANNLQNFPGLKSVTNTSGSVNITGTFNSAANTTFRLEFFRNDVVDPSGFGEGQVFLGFANVTTDANCNASFDLNFPTLITARGVTATATDPLGNTSEFSAAIGQLLNIATRLRVQTGDNVLIGGFIVTGTESKKVLARGIGPSLAALFPDFLANPTLELFQGNTSLATNDDWKTRPDGSSQQAEIEATTIPPTNDLESALVRTLPANNAGYTAIVRGKDNTTGIGVVEVYDLDTAANSKLANISTRGLVETGNNVLIGGFIPGNGVTKVIIRAIGPTLVNAGVPDPLQNPTLDLVNGSGTTLATNDDWKTRPDGSSQQAEIEATTIPPNDDRESALVASLPPGNYTAVVRGKNNTIGIAVVEVYNIP